MYKRLIDKYKNKLDFISDIGSLSMELVHNKVEPEEIISIILKISDDNKKILNIFKNLNQENIEKIKKVECTEIVEKNYKISQKTTIPKKIETIKKEEIDISFYTQLINDDINNIYLFLPKTKDKDSVRILDLIMIYYLKDNAFLKRYMVLEDDKKEKSNYVLQINNNNEIINLLKKYKEELFLETKEEIEKEKNNVSYYLNSKNKPYIIDDIDDDKNALEVAISLIKSIEDGTFKNVKPFTNNNNLKGIYEVRDLANRVRVFFTIDNNKYTVFYCLTDKQETNSIYTERLTNRYKKYKLNNVSIQLTNKELIKRFGE